MVYPQNANFVRIQEKGIQKEIISDLINSYLKETAPVKIEGDYQVVCINPNELVIEILDPEVEVTSPDGEKIVYKQNC
jgi:hypothetical protein